MKEDNRDTTNMPTYTVEHPNFAGQVCVATYELPWAVGDGRMVAQLRSVTFNETSRHGFIRSVLQLLPSVIQMRVVLIPIEMEALIRQRCVVKACTTMDLSFERFWDAYGYKVGNKATVKKKWAALRDEDRLLAMQGIQRQRRHSEQHRTDMPYPQTYIDQRRWENEFGN